MEFYPSLTAIVLLAVATTGWLRQARATDAVRESPVAIWDEAAAGSEMIADALTVAASGNKHVLLQFGASWCPWCHRLHDLLAVS